MCEGTVNKISYGLDAMSIGKEEGSTHMTLDQFQNATFASNHNNNTAIPNKKMCLLKFYLIGNVKGNFQILRRSVYDSSYYML